MTHKNDRLMVWPFHVVASRDDDESRAAVVVVDSDDGEDRDEGGGGGGGGGGKMASTAVAQITHSAEEIDAALEAYMVGVHCAIDKRVHY